MCMPLWPCQRNNVWTVCAFVRALVFVRVVFLDVSPWLLLGCLLMWINQWRGPPQSHRGFSTSATKETRFHSLRSNQCSPDSPSNPRMERQWWRTAVVELGWGNVCHLGHFPQWAGQTEHSGPTECLLLHQGWDYSQPTVRHILRKCRELSSCLLPLGCQMNQHLCACITGLI